LFVENILSFKLMFTSLLLKGFNVNYLFTNSITGKWDEGG
jgi:hypothetical protein